MQRDVASMASKPFYALMSSRTCPSRSLLPFVMRTAVRQSTASSRSMLHAFQSPILGFTQAATHRDQPPLPPVGREGERQRPQRITSGPLQQQSRQMAPKSSFDLPAGGHNQIREPAVVGNRPYHALRTLSRRMRAGYISGSSPGKGW